MPELTCSQPASELNPGYCMVRCCRPVSLQHLQTFLLRWVSREEGLKTILVAGSYWLCMTRHTRKAKLATYTLLLKSLKAPKS